MLIIFRLPEYFGARGTPAFTFKIPQIFNRRLDTCIQQYAHKQKRRIQESDLRAISGKIPFFN
ncbi:hypothetical protein [Kingella negevensis]|uniref:hypothetical protein n=1 Tax=Kingella negevensis TaxID=1522312 RepID=UPI000A904D8B|nr:hypothetical protein [Kingella negevensis]